LAKLSQPPFVKKRESWIKPLDDFDTSCEVAPRVAATTLATLFGRYLEYFMMGEALLHPNGGSLAKE
jgi:hypothetical protein